jgi:hypothetical protein
MSFIIAGCALLLALIASILLDDTSADSKRDATSHPFMGGDPEHERGGCVCDVQPYGATCLLDGQ